MNDLKLQNNKIDFQTEGPKSPRSDSNMIQKKVLADVWNEQTLVKQPKTQLKHKHTRADAGGPRWKFAGCCVAVEGAHILGRQQL